MQPLRGSRPVFYVTQEFVRKSNLGEVNYKTQTVLRLRALLGLHMIHSTYPFVTPLSWLTQSFRHYQINCMNFTANKSAKQQCE